LKHLEKLADRCVGRMRQSIVLALISCYSTIHGFTHQNIGYASSYRQLVRRQGNWGLPPPLVKKDDKPQTGEVALGVDYGTRVIGTSISAGWAQKRLLPILHTGDDLEVARHLVDLAFGELAKTIVVGLPLHKDGTESYQSEVTREFCALVAAIAGRRLRVVLVDERYTSKFASAQMQHMKERDRVAAIDEESACAILETYFSSSGGTGGGGGELVPVDPSVLEEALRVANAALVKAQYEEDLASSLASDKELWLLDDTPTDEDDPLGKNHPRWTPPVFDFDLDGEVARRAAALGGSFPGETEEDMEEEEEEEEDMEEEENDDEDEEDADDEDGDETALRRLDIKAINKILSR